MGIIQVLEILLKSPRQLIELDRVSDCSKSVIYRVIKRACFYGYVEKRDGEVFITEEGITYLKNVRRYYK